MTEKSTPKAPTATKAASTTPTVFKIWEAMIRSCSHVNNPLWEDIGGRGITVCPEWRIYENFLRDMGPRPTGAFFRRIDVTKDFSPANCQWSAPTLRTESGAPLVQCCGRTMALADWAAEMGMSKATLGDRLRSGWPIEKALTTPVTMGGKRKGSSPQLSRTCAGGPASNR